MTTFAEAILTIILSFKPSLLETMPEVSYVRQARLEVVATAIAEASEQASCYQAAKTDCKPILRSREQAAGVLIVQAWKETGFRHDIQIGQCRPYECDKGLAKGPWQLHRGPAPLDVWEAYASLGVDDLRRAATRTLQLWAGAAIEGPWCGFARLGGFTFCPSDYGRDRAKLAEKLEQQLRKKTP